MLGLNTLNSGAEMVQTGFAVGINTLKTVNYAVKGVKYKAKAFCEEQKAISEDAEILATRIEIAKTELGNELTKRQLVAAKDKAKLEKKLKKFNAKSSGLIVTNVTGA